MSQIYRNPPLIEALCEFKFEPGQAWDSTLPGELWAQYKADFPEKAEQHRVEFKINPDGSPSAQPVSILRFRRSDQNALVQISDNALVINQLPPYPKWENFLALIETQLARYIGVAQPKSVIALALRYINRLELPALSDERASDYCVILPIIPRVFAEIEPEEAVGFTQRIEIEKPSLNGVLSLQAGSTAHVSSDHVGFLLDVTFTSLNPIALGDIGTWIRQAHEHIERAFEACLTDKARKLFQPL